MLNTLYTATIKIIIVLSELYKKFLCFITLYWSNNKEYALYMFLSDYEIYFNLMDYVSYYTIFINNDFRVNVDITQYKIKLNINYKGSTYNGDKISDITNLSFLSLGTSSEIEKTSEELMAQLQKLSE